MPSAGLRFAGEAAFLILVALGLGLADFDPIVIGVVMFVAWLLVAVLERASSREAAQTDGERERTPEPAPEPPPHVERVELERVPVNASVEEPETEAESEIEPQPTVSERSARAILASGPPPLPPTPPAPPKAKPARRRFVERAVPAPPPPPPEPEPEPIVTAPPREWNVWELQRAVRDTADERHEEWSALLIHLREFANADGDLPVEFDGLVRESFGAILEAEPEPAAAP